MSTPLNLAHLMSLTAVVDHDGFTRAARALHLSQSTVSQHVYLLEQRLDTSLLIRDHRGLRLTAAGERLLDGGRSLLAAHDALVERFVPAAEPTIAVGATEHAADHLLPRVFDALRRAYPSHRVSFTLNRSADLVAAIAADRLDLALTLAVADDAPGKSVGSLGLHWLAAPDFPLAPDDPTLALVAFDGSCGIRERALHRLKGVGRNAEIAVEASTLDGVVSAARAGLGVALLPVAVAPPTGLREVTGLPDTGTVTVNLIARRNFDEEMSATAGAAVGALLDPH